MDEEKKYKEDLKAAGVDLPELKEETDIPEDKTKKEETPKEPEKPVEPEKKVEEKEGDDKKEPEKKDPNLLDKKPEESRKPRSIYTDYKDQKEKTKTEKERADIAEQRAADLQKQIDEFTAKAKEGDKPTNADEDELIKKAEESGADPDLIKHIIKVARQGVKTGDYDALKKDIDELKTTSQKAIEENQKLAEEKAFDEEFSSVLPTIKEFFPSATTEEINTIKKELDGLSHKKDWHDKDLDYIVFKNKDTLSAFVSPKKRGMESREKKDVEVDSYDFDPNADLSKMTQAQRDTWESEYRKAGKSDGLLVGADGKKLIL